MTDAEINSKCAERMGIPYQRANNDSFVARMDHPTQTYNGIYDPLHDDAQAMALVKKFNLHISSMPPEYLWAANWFKGGEHCSSFSATDKDLNRAICDCVANLHVN